MKTIALVMTALMLAGCSSVMMQTPFPDSELTKEEMNALRGTWQLDKSTFYIEFAANGRPCMASVEWEDDRFQIVELDLHIVKRKGSYYLSLQAEDEQGHLFAAFKPRNREIAVWGPDPAFFKSRIAAGKLKGTVKEEDMASEIVLATPAPDILDLIASDPAAIDFEEPLIIRKLD